MNRIVDISLPLDAGYRMHTPDGVRNVQLEFEVIKDYAGGGGQRVGAVHMRLHTGTHVDAPMHFLEGGDPIDALPLATFYGPGVMADLTHIAEDAPITVSELQAALGDSDVRGARVFLRTNWNAHYGEPDYADRSPYISVEAVRWLKDQRPLLVSYDYAHAKDDPEAPEQYFSIRTFTRAGIVTMGYVTRLDEIDASRPFTVAAFPLAFKGVESSPVRAVLIQDEV